MKDCQRCRYKEEGKKEESERGIDEGTKDTSRVGLKGETRHTVGWMEIQLLQRERQ